MRITELPVPDDSEHLFVRGTDMVGGLIGLIKRLYDWPNQEAICKRLQATFSRLHLGYHDTFPYGPLTLEVYEHMLQNLVLPAVVGM